MASARALQARGRFQASLALLEALAEERPDDAEVGLLYGRALLRSGRSGAAVWPLRRAAEDPAYEVEANLLLATALDEGQNHPDAIAAVDRVLERDPEDLRALELRGRIQLRARNEEAALADLERVLEAEPDRLDARIYRAMALIQLGRLDEAEGALDEATTLAESREDAPPAGVATLCALRAVFASERGEPDEARSRFETCIANHPTNALVVSEYVVFLDERREHDRAREVLAEAIERAPRRLDLRIALAGRIRAAGDAEEAERLLLEVEAPPLAKWTALGDHYVALRDWDRAQAAFGRALEGVDEPLPIVAFGYADALIQGGELDRAHEVAETLAPPFSDLLRGRIAFERGELESAIRWLEAGLARWPHNPMAHLLTARASERLGDLDGALLHYREAVRAGPADTTAALELASLHEAMGSYEAGVTVLQAYFAERPVDPDAYVSLARLAAQSGKNDLADETFRRMALLPGQEARAVAEASRLVREYGDPAEAARLVEVAGIDLSRRENRAALAAYVEAWVAAGRTEEALARIESALEAHPDDLVLKAIRARALAADGRPAAEVRAALAEARDQEETVPAAYTALAALLADGGEPEEALAIYDRVSAARPDDPEPAFAAAMLLLERGEIDRGERRLEALLVSHPRHTRAALQLARILATRPSELERAEALANRAVRLRGGPDAVEVLGRLRLARGDAAGAARAFEVVLEHRPGSPSVRYLLAHALSATGQEEAALAAYRAALASGGFPERARAELELAELEAARSRSSALD